MGWSHPDILLEDLMQLIKGYVDMLILASGYLSSGSTASWDSENIKKALQWGFFFEEVLSRFHDSDSYNRSIEELDAALFEMTSTSSFPQGLKNLSSTTLSRAREFVIEHFFQTIPLRDTHFRALLDAAIEMDIEKNSDVDLYIENLTTQTKSLDMLPEKMRFVNKFITTSCANNTSGNPEHVLSNKILYLGIGDKKRISRDNSTVIIQEILKRQAAVSCLSSVQTCNNAIWTMIQALSFTSTVNGGANSPFRKDVQNRLLLYGQWRSRGLSYLQNSRTLNLLSGAEMIFSAPNDQWIRIFENLTISDEACQANLLEIIELALLGLILGSWKYVIERLMTASFDYPPVSDQYLAVQSLLHGPEFLMPNIKPTRTQGDSLIEYLTNSLASQTHLLWKMPPILVAASIPSGSILFRLYLNDIEKQLTRQDSSVKLFFAVSALATRIEKIIHHVSLLRGFGACTCFVSRIPTLVNANSALHTYCLREEAFVLVDKNVIPVVKVSLFEISVEDSITTL